MSNTLPPPQGGLKRQYTGLSDNFLTGNERK